MGGHLLPFLSGLVLFIFHSWDGCEMLHLKYLPVTTDQGQKVKMTGPSPHPTVIEKKKTFWMMMVSRSQTAL